MIDLLTLWLMAQVPMDQQYRINEQNSGNAQKYCQSMTEQRNFGEYKLVDNTLYEFQGDSNYRNVLNYWVIDPSRCRFRKVALLNQEYSVYTKGWGTRIFLWKLENDDSNDWRYRTLGTDKDVLLCEYSRNSDSSSNVTRRCISRLVKCQGPNYGDTLQDPSIFSTRVQISDARCRLRPLSVSE